MAVVLQGTMNLDNGTFESWWPSIIECYLIYNVFKPPFIPCFSLECLEGSVQGLASGCINSSSAVTANHPNTPPIFNTFPTKSRVFLYFISNVFSLLPKKHRKIRLMFYVPRCLSANHFWRPGLFSYTVPYLFETWEISVKRWSIGKAGQIHSCSCKLVPTLENSFLGLRVQCFFSKMWTHMRMEEGKWKWMLEQYTSVSLKVNSWPSKAPIFKILFFKW